MSDSMMDNWKRTAGYYANMVADKDGKVTDPGIFISPRDIAIAEAVRAKCAKIVQDSAWHVPDDMVGYMNGAQETIEELDLFELLPTIPTTASSEG